MEAFLEVLARHCQQQGMKTALACGNQRITYADLVEYSDNVAYFLKQKGIGKEQIVAILMERGIDSIVAMMGIWKAGAAFLCLSDEYPEERIQSICADCQVSLVLNQTMMDQIRSSVKPDGVSLTYPAMEDAAMVLYTSGSTGKPKGILHDHRSILYAMERHQIFNQLSEKDVFLANSPFYFIVMSYEILSPLYAGCSVHFLPEQERKNMQAIEDYMSKESITASLITAQLLKHFKHPNPELRLLFTGAERVSNIKGAGAYRLVNLYGSSETGGAALRFLIDRCYENTPVGRPAKGTCAYLLDEQGRLVVDGEAGELCLSGVFARGYINLPELTAKTFTANPFAEVDGNDVLYHTGDMARRLPDGNILYINRKDWQVKINGQRVELGEIEMALSAFPDIENAVVQAFTKPNGQAYLCAYYQGTYEIERQSLKEFLAGKLPIYMVPEFYIRLKELPLNMNGKLDRKQLTPPTLTGGEQGREPVTAMEKTICEGFAQVLKVRPIWLDSDFYLAGGDSLAVMELVAWLADKDIMIQAEQVASHSTPKLLAEALQHTFIEKLPELPEGTTADVFSMSDTQIMMAETVRAMACDGIDPMMNELVMTFALDAAVDAERLQQIITEVVAELDIFHLQIDRGNHSLSLAKQGNLKLSLIPGEQKHTLCIEGSHLLFDGVFIQQLLQYLAKRYNHEETEEFQSFYSFTRWLVLLEKTSLMYKDAEKYYTNMKAEAAHFQYIAQPEEQARKWHIIMYNKRMALSERLSELCATLHCSRYQLFYACYIKALSLWKSGTVCCFSVLNQRQYPQCARVTGCLTNRFYLLVKNPEKLGLKELVQQVKEGIAKGQQYGFYPAWRIMDPLVQEYPYVAFNYTDVSATEKIHFGHVPLSERHIEQGDFFDIPLLLGLEGSSNELNIIFLGREDMTSRACMRELTELYASVLQEAIESV